MKLVFEVRIRPGYTAEAYAAAWVRASEIIQRAPGARGTRLHRKIGDPNVLLAIAEWDSKAHRDAMDAALRDDPTLRAIFEEQGRHCDINVIGEFAEPDWTVLP